MGQVLHGGATTTAAIRRAIQHSRESLRTLARRHGINPKTVAKWRRRCSVADLPTGPRTPRSTVLTLEEEAVVVAFRKHTLLPHGQVEGINRTIKEATVQRYSYDRHKQLQTHLSDFIVAYNFAKRLKTLGGLTAYEFICKCGQKEPHRFNLDPIHQMPALNT
jgi:transposase-like protein